MEVLRTVREFRDIAGSGSAFIPTMGALHLGHLSLIETAKSLQLPVSVSIFVNPLQFGPNEDYDRYPRTFDSDLAGAESAGADFVFAPPLSEMAAGNDCRLHVAGITDRFEGALRPGHFDGVATVVAKLFHIVCPNVALFGLKDLQQCAVIAAMVRDLFFPVELCFCETKREPDGLAMSSRNIYLTAEERLRAPNLYRNLRASRQLILTDGDIVSALEAAKENLSGIGFEVQYFDLVDKSSFQPVSIPDINSFLIVAAKIGSVRLIDNLSLFDAQ